MTTTSLAAALVLAQANARAVGLDAKNNHHGYRYASAEGIIMEARGALASAGLALLTLGWDFDGSATSGGAIGRVIVRYELVHTSGESKAFQSSSPVVPERGRPADKAEAGALTTNLGYLLRGLLLLPRDDEAASMDQRDDRDYEPPRSDREERRDPPRERAQQQQQQQGPGPASAPTDWTDWANDIAARMNDAATQQAVAAVYSEAEKVRGIPADVLASLKTITRQIYETKPRAPKNANGATRAA